MYIPPAFLQTHWLGRIPYDEGLRTQEELVAKKIAGDSTNYLLLLEHEPVYTIGRTQDQGSLGKDKLSYPLHRIGRGGQATYHGPGQLVAYPILDLNIVQRDLHDYLRLLEEVIIKTMALYQLTGSRRDGMTGVWSEGRKIASLGIGVRKWISFHGLALNICGDLTPFNEITPCGLTGVTMTSLEQELINKNTPAMLTVEEVSQKLSDSFKKVFALI